MVRASCLLLAVIVCAAGCKRTRTEKEHVIVVTPAQQASALGFQPPLVTVAMASAGFTVRVREANVAPGCDGLGPGLAVPAKDGKQQFMALRICMEKLKWKMPGLDGQSSAILEVAPTTPYGEVIEAMDAMRSTVNGQTLFPDITFSQTAAPDAGAGARRPGP